MRLGLSPLPRNVVADQVTQTFSTDDLKGLREMLFFERDDSLVPAAATTPVADRKAAEWALSVGATVEIDIDSEGGYARTIRPGGTLPAARFTLSGVLFEGCDKVPADGLTNFAHVPTLRKLVVHETPGLNELQHLDRLPGIDSFSTRSATLSDAAAGRIASLANLVELRFGSAISDAGFEKLASLPKLRMFHNHSGTNPARLATVLKLRRLRFLHGDFESDKDVARLASLPSLQALSLGSGKVTGEGFAALKDLPLRGVFIHPNPVDDANLKHLAAIKTLKVLVLGKSKITDDGLLAFAGHPTLVGIDVEGNEQLTRAGFEKLQKSAPNLAIQWTNKDFLPAPHGVSPRGQWLAESDHLAMLEGSWTAIHEERNGAIVDRKKDGPRRITLRGDDFTMNTDVAGKPGEYRGKVLCNSWASPGGLVNFLHVRNGASVDIKSGYDLRGSVLKLAYSRPTYGDWPGTFKTTNNPALLQQSITLVRDEPDKADRK